MITKKFVVLLLILPLFLFAQSQKQFENITLIGNDNDIHVLESTLSQFDNSIFGFQKSVGYYLDDRIKIHIAKDKAEYQTWTGSSNNILEFSQAFYSRKSDSIYLRNPSELKSIITLQRILLHEYIHHFISKFYKNAPLWFHEGMAVYFSGDMGFDREFNFAKNYVLGNSRPLALMAYSYPKNRIEWESFYAKSGLAVKYLYNKKRVEFYRFWDFSRRDGSFESAFRKAFLMSTSEFSKYFEDYAKSHFRTEILLASTGMIWSILPLFLIIGVIRKKIRNRKRIKEWEEEDLTNDLSNPSP
ncbi:MAG: hypothetical protein K9N09_08980 [Candidatus Cloacimonetes bacterium]|nr:hypothetical protein [Candidatus Cloacimonadota bacterium]MCF7813976.1 hypothetical protein [Candidatus Cloacimonadota bacterium]MCF7868820.1 hypothetical protein [Candidatus Cloacimonadota bacterium]MCF7884079.1 hypothetical protein [Candidatus Cloacimonadota bacterium]